MNAIEFKGVSKCFGDFFANKNLSFCVRSGTIHGLIGENGAGKSTAMKVLFGVHSLDEGEILIQGKPSSIRNPVQAMRLGIGMVHQHFMLAPSETVLDNIILGHEPGTIQISRKKALAELEEISRSYGLSFNRWNDLVEDLSVGEQQRVEIIKLLYQKSQVLILDEPTAVLTPQEVEELFKNLSRLKSEGKTIVLISHKLKEVLAHTDSITVMRRGEIVDTFETAKTNENELAQAMVGRPVSFTYSGERKIFAKQTDANAVLRLDHVSIGNVKEPIRNISIDIKPGEILGVAGVQGNGQTTLLRFLCNPHRFHAHAIGEYHLRGKDVTHYTPLELRERGLGWLPEDRLHEGLILEQSMVENFLLGQHRDPRYQKGGLLLRPKAKSVVSAKIKEFDIRPNRPDKILRRMSGGNQQKLVIARVLDPSPEVVLIAHPTRGVDVGAIEKIHDAIIQERNRGRAILLLSSELDELIDLADRIVVFFNGEIRREFQRSEFDAWKMGRVMGGGEA